jgi:hypothetical protein
MRLLNVHTQQLEEFHGKTIPKYVIVSHTWGKEEVTFADITSIYSATNHAQLDLLSPDTFHGQAQEIRVKAKAGYAKIQHACSTAKNAGYKYVWIDTCCIDKSSSSELSEAINSMFRWYQQADLCYAYLDDVVHTEHKTMMSKSRWFTRGWTLQELLSPSKITFYGTNFRFIASKTYLADQISQITGIEKRALLETGYIKLCSIAQRMSWAANRETTREEDMAYSLMGIFGVNMPLLYGEGPNAFIRLQEEIMKNSDDQSIFAWKPRVEPSTEPRTCSILASTPDDFSEARSISPIPNKLATIPYNMTNQGLQINLPLVPVNDKDLPDSHKFYVGILTCQDENDLSKWLGISLMGTANTNVLVRLVGPSLGLLRLTPAQVSQGQVQTVYILKDETKASIAIDYKTCWVKSDSAKDLGYRVTSTRPRSWQWNKESQVMRIQNEGKPSTAQFFFTSPEFQTEFEVVLRYKENWEIFDIFIRCDRHKSVNHFKTDKSIGASLVSRLEKKESEVRIPMYISVKACEEEVLNQSVIVIDITLEAGERAESQPLS